MNASRRWTKPGLVAALAAALGVCAAAAPATWAYGAEGQFERTLKVTGPVDLEVKTGSGSIAVRTGEPGGVRVKGIIRASDSWFFGKDAEEKVRLLESNPPIVQDGNSIRIGHIEDRDLRQNISISYELVVPVETRLRTDTGSGDQIVEGIRGPLNADSGSGDLTLTRIGGDVVADTGSGDIEIESIRGSVRTDTGSGSIRAIGVAGSFWADSGSGDVEADLTAAGQVVVDTGSGSVEIRGVRGSVQVGTGSGSISIEGEPRGTWKLDAGSGTITVRLPAETGFELDARTNSGRVTSDHPVTVQGAMGKNELRGKVRGGGSRLELSTGSGDIRIE